MAGVILVIMDFCLLFTGKFIPLQLDRLYAVSAVLVVIGRIGSLAAPAAIFETMRKLAFAAWSKCVGAADDLKESGIFNRQLLRYFNSKNPARASRRQRRQLPALSRCCRTLRCSSGGDWSLLSCGRRHDRQAIPTRGTGASVILFPYCLTYSGRSANVKVATDYRHGSCSCPALILVIAVSCWILTAIWLL